MSAWNPRHVAFAKSNGRTAEEQAAIDECDTDVALDLVAHALDLTRIADALDGAS